MYQSRLAALRSLQLTDITARLSSLMTPKTVWIIWGITRAIMLLNLVVGKHYCDPQFYQYAGDLAVGKFPYINVQVEYPPFALVMILLPALPLLPFAGIAPRPELDPHPWHPDPLRYGAYGTSFGIMMLIIDAVTLVLVMRAARMWTKSDSQGSRTALLYTLLVFASGAVLQKFELLIGTLCLLSIIMLLQKREGIAWASLALATLLKGYPVLLVPVFIIWMYYQNRINWNVVKRSVIGGGIVSAFLLGPILLLSGTHPLLYSVIYHRDRGIEIETVWSSIMIVGGWFNGWSPVSYYNPADLSADITSIIDGPLLQFSSAVLLGTVFWAYIIFARRMQASRRTISRTGAVESVVDHVLAMQLIHVTLLIMLVFLLSFKALGLHYLVGILPLVALIRLPGRYTTVWLTTIITGLVFGQFTVTFFNELINLQPGAEWLLIIRNTCFVAATVVLAVTPLLSLWGEAIRRNYHESSAIIATIADPAKSPI